MLLKKLFVPAFIGIILGILSIGLVGAQSPELSTRGDPEVPFDESPTIRVKIHRTGPNGEHLVCNTTNKELLIGALYR
jgi:hypothetical protein